MRNGTVCTHIKSTNKANMYYWILLSVVTLVASEFDPDIQEKYEKLPTDEFIEYFNNQSFSYKIARNDHLKDKNYLTCVKLRSLDDVPILIHGSETLKNLPTNFDPREKWANCSTIKEVYEQGNCGSCWTFGSATTMSDRMCIHINKIARLSEQDFECCSGCVDPGESVCDGGYSEHAFDFWIKNGLVTQECKQYDVTELRKRICNKKCVDGNINYENDKHFGSKWHTIGYNDEQIKAELVTNGPMQASFEVYVDFMSYNGGIYEHKYGELQGYHSVRLLGYGEEKGLKYWLVANSWGQRWGEKGLFKIKRFQESVHIEKYLIAGLPKK